MLIDGDSHGPVSRYRAGLPSSRSRGSKEVTGYSLEVFTLNAYRLPRAVHGSVMPVTLRIDREQMATQWVDSGSSRRARVGLDIAGNPLWIETCNGTWQRWCLWPWCKHIT